MSKTTPRILGDYERGLVMGSISTAVVQKFIKDDLEVRTHCMLLSNFSNFWATA